MGNNSILQRIEITPNAKKTSSGGTEVDELPNGWRIVKLGEVFKFTKKPKELRYSEFDKIPFIPMDLLPLGSTSFEQFILKSKDDISSGTYFESGDILIAKITPSFENGKQGIIEKLPTPFGIATTEVIPIKEIEGISDKYYLFYYLLRQDIRTELAGKMEGSTGRQRLNISTLASLELPLPPLPQQITIAKVLWTIQEAIQARRDELDLERERKADLMEYLFTRGSGGDSVSTKKTKFGSVPVSWKLMVLEQCAFVQTGVAKGRKFSDNHTINLPYLRVANVQDGYLDLTEIKYIKLRESEVERYKLQPDDVVVTEGGDFDKLGRGFL